ncbi:hypothetical protein CYY_007925 [Polysphondylium violaceum]|uniref:Uncharacterized protein n=1 Tax=Polysphondylium violaceum TaxID=133409 RepID=A0A8J4PPK1_9MYCE|nr:hypothetical protein CYY_007925 [Polysphondylium violaceum]
MRILFTSVKRINIVGFVDLKLGIRPNCSNLLNFNKIKIIWNNIIDETGFQVDMERNHEVILTIGHLIPSMVISWNSFHMLHPLAGALVTGTGFTGTWGFACLGADTGTSTFGSTLSSLSSSHIDYVYPLQQYAKNLFLQPREVAERSSNLSHDLDFDNNYFEKDNNSSNDTTTTNRD